MVEPDQMTPAMLVPSPARVKTSILELRTLELFVVRRPRQGAVPVRMPSVKLKVEFV